MELNKSNEKFMSKIYLLVGPPGSGKSTYAKTLNATIINQDEIGDRKKCILQAGKALEQGLDIIIDRCNINKAQRSYWIYLAKQHNAQIQCIEFIAEPEECVKRIMKRKNHPTINNMTESKVRDILNKFVKEYEVPNAIKEHFSSHITFYVDNIIASERKDSNGPFHRYWRFITAFFNKITRRS